MGKKQTTTEHTTSEPWAAAQPYMQDVLQNTQQAYNQNPGGIGATTNNALTQIEQMAGQGSPGVTAANGYNNDVLSGHYLNEGSNPYLSRIWDDQADEVTNRLKDLYSGIGRYGSAPMEGELAKSLGSLHSQLYGGQYNAERDRMTSAAGMAPALDQARYTAPQQLLAAGAYRDQAPKDALSWYNSIVGPMGQQGGTSNTATTQPGPSILQTLLGIGTTVAGFMSDRRMKQDIRRVGTTEAGIPIYTYRYKNGDPTTYMGVMAQEAQPEAVLDVDGILYVDYTKVH